MPSYDFDHHHTVAAPLDLPLVHHQPLSSTTRATDGEKLLDEIKKKRNDTDLMTAKQEDKKSRKKLKI